jgi:hypothetical protein
MHPLSLHPGKPVYNSTDARRTLGVSQAAGKMLEPELFAFRRKLSRSSNNSGILGRLTFANQAIPDLSVSLESLHDPGPH